MFNAPTSLNNLKAKIDNLNVIILKTVPVELKRLSDVVDNEVVKNMKFSTLHYLKKVSICSCSGPYFPPFGLNTRDTPYFSIFGPNMGIYGPE